ncbi:MAG: GNAT family N-acetyltransferase [Burkholderiales bacterium]
MQISKADVNVRVFTIAEYSKVIEFWSNIDGLALDEFADTAEAIAAFLERNPGFSAVALDANDQIIGAVLCGHNGRAGALYHLAVAEPHRGKGIALALVSHCYAKLTEAKIPRCNIFVYSDNDEGNRFWLLNGFVDPTTWKVMQKRLEP